VGDGGPIKITRKIKRKIRTGEGRCLVLGFVTPGLVEVVGGVGVELCVASLFRGDVSF